MFINFVDWVKKENLMSVPLRGIVVDNNDPKKMGRVKVNIEGMTDGIPTEDLPWYFSLNQTGLGGTGTDSWFSVPKEGSEVYITFPYDDIYFGLYSGFIHNSITVPEIFKDNYKDRYGFVDGKGNEFVVDMSDDEIWIKHGSSGSVVKFGSDGDILVDIKDKIVINSAKTIEVTATMDINITSATKVVISAPFVDVT